MNPGDLLGIVGGGQLGRMAAQAAQRLGLRVAVYDPAPGSPAGMLAQMEMAGAFDDSKRIAEFAGACDRVTFEFENISAGALRAAAAKAELHPSPAVLEICQNRAREKAFLSASGFPCARHREIDSAEGLVSALEELGCPAVLKTADFGYDGKGQTRIEDSSQAETAWAALDAPRGVVEAWVPFEREISVICARSAGAHAEVVTFEPVENRHSNHILDLSIAPAALPPRVRSEAIDLAKAIAERLDLVGIIAVEMFLLPDGGLLVNELAPRPHNSGHLTIEACVTGQFEQFVRAVYGLPLGSPELLRPAAMANLLGDLWADGEPRWASALSAVPDVKLHLYGKREARPGRKMGHLTALGGTPGEAAKKVLAARAALCPSGSR